MQVCVRGECRDRATVAGWGARGVLRGGSRSRGPSGSAVLGPGPGRCPGGLVALEARGVHSVAARVSGECPKWLLQVTGVISPRGRPSRVWRQAKHVKGREPGLSQDLGFVCVQESEVCHCFHCFPIYFP